MKKLIIMTILVLVSFAYSKNVTKIDSLRVKNVDITPQEGTFTCSLFVDNTYGGTADAYYLRIGRSVTVFLEILRNTSLPSNYYCWRGFPANIKPRNYGTPTYTVIPIQNGDGQYGYAYLKISASEDGFIISLPTGVSWTEAAQWKGTFCSITLHYILP